MLLSKVLKIKHYLKAPLSLLQWFLYIVYYLDSLSLHALEVQLWYSCLTYLSCFLMQHLPRLPQTFFLFRLLTHPQRSEADIFHTVFSFPTALWKETTYAQSKMTVLKHEKDRTLFCGWRSPEESAKGVNDKTPEFAKCSSTEVFNALGEFKKSGIQCLFEVLYLALSQVLLLPLALV